MRGIKIKNLYGRFYYEIMLAEEGMTILTGPNGFGKSTILHMIGALANSDMEFFFDLPFSEIEVIGNGDDSNFVIRKEKESLFIDGKEFDRQRINEWKNPKGWLHLDGKFENMYSDHRTDEITKIVFTLKQITGNVFFIEEQRLVKSGVERRTRADGSRVMERRLIQTVKEISEKLRMKMNKTTKGYSAISNELDSTFPQRLFAQEVGLSEREFNEKLLSMREKVSKLQKYGISNVGKFDDILFKEDDARALKVYFDDFEMKLSGRRLSYGKFEGNANKREKLVLEKMNYDNVVNIKKGYFPDSTYDMEEIKYSFVHIDVDLYKPTKAGLEYFWPRMSPGGYIFCHDLQAPTFPAARIAIKEFCEENGVSYVPMNDNRTGVLAKPLS